MSSPAVYRAGNLLENLSVALDQKFGQAKITPPEAGRDAGDCRLAQNALPFRVRGAFC